MRNRKRWIEAVYPRLLKVFPPRIQKDLKAIPFPTDIKAGSAYLWGKLNTGKTILACHMLLQSSLDCYLSKDVNTVEFTNTLELLEKIRNSFNIGSPDKEIVLHYKTVDVLVLDEFGMDKSTEWVLATLYLIINYRYEHLLTTIVTSNLSPKEAAEQMGDTRIIKRMLQMAVVVHKEGWK